MGIEQAGVQLRNRYVIFGDSAYKHQDHIRTYKKQVAGEPRDPLRSAWNHAMKSTRISIEWNYGNTASHFKYMANQAKMKLLESSTVTEIYVVATLFRNFHVGCYGCQTSNYFNLEIPNFFLENYINKTNFN